MLSRKETYWKFDEDYFESMIFVWIFCFLVHICVSVHQIRDFAILYFYFDLQRT